MKRTSIKTKITSEEAMQAVNIQYFRKKILGWNRSKNDRIMPWKGENNPYRIWLSEIMLQQTRVEQGLKYYNKFIYKYPRIQDLAQTADDEVFKDWEGLGYYSRCRNMLFTARYISKELNGQFPTEYNDILALKGVGPYTAAAIASFAYNKPYAVVDGNVVRVFSRFLGIDLPFVSNKDKLTYQSIADSFLAKRTAAEYNQTIMDFGATMCKPQNPLCTACPLSKKCIAYQTDRVGALPPKKPKVVLKKRYFHYIIAEENNKIYLKKRLAGDVWQDLYEPILIEQKGKPAIVKNEKVLETKVQKLSHQELYIYFYIINNVGEIPIDLDLYQAVSRKSLSKKALPKSVFDFFKEYEYI